jgi:RNA recognition motif-containing protein
LDSHLLFCVCLAKVIKGKDGRNRGFAFITMSTAEEAAAAVDKFNASVVVASDNVICLES